MYGVVCGVHHGGVGGGERSLRVMRSSVFCKHLQFLPGKQEAAPNFWKKKQNSNRLKMNETVCQVQSG